MIQQWSMKDICDAVYISITFMCYLSFIRYPYRPIHKTTWKCQDVKRVNK